MNDSTERLDFLIAFKEAIQNTAFPHESVKNEIVKMIDFIENDHFGIISFSRERDLLSQWISYADDGNGYAIGVDTTNLEKILKRRKRGFNTILRDIGNVFINQTIYTNEEKGSVIDYLVEKCKTMEPKTGKWSSAFISLQNELLKNACSFKNSCFKEEHETRLVKWFREYHQNDQELYEEGYLKENYDHRSVSGIPRLYYKHDLEPSWIKEIIIGPKSNAEIDDIKQFAKELGFPADQITVTKSKATYR